MSRYMIHLSLVISSLIVSLGAAEASPRADALLDTIDVFLTPTNMKEAGLDAAYAERVLGDVDQRRYRRVRALGALTLLAPARALALLPQLLIESEDRELRAQSAIHLVRVFAERRPAQVAAALSAAQRARPQDAKLRALITTELARLKRLKGLDLASGAHGEP